jgi:hypothetical protein
MSYHRPPPGRYDIGQQRAQRIDNVAGDQHNYGPTIDLLPGRAGRMVIITGVLVAFAGFAAFAYPIVSFILVVFSAVQQQSSTPPDLSQVSFTPWLPLGMAAIALGSLLSIVGALMRRRR